MARFSAYFPGLWCLVFMGCQPVDTASLLSDRETTERTEANSISVELNSTIDVVLGNPVLTSGIPGQGDLTIEEIRAFINDPDNHRPLNVSLPMGLSAAQDNIVGIEKNPMTIAKVELGRQLYFDTRMSKDNTVSCASCHDPDYGYTKDTQFGVGIGLQKGTRNSPVVYNRILSNAQFWDGRAESLEAQTMFPITNSFEMGNTHENCVETLAGIDGYRIQFEKIFSDGVTIDNVAKAIATFERTLVTGPTGYDYLEVVRGIESQWGEDIDELEEEDPELFLDYSNARKVVANLSSSTLRGRDLFFSEEINCAACHAGANFADERYHNLGVGMEVDEPDLGRFTESNMDIDRGAFKTPTIRNVALSGPYMHDGSQKTLEEVVEWYAKGGHANPFLSEKVTKLELSEQDKADLVAFMKEGLIGDLPPVETGRLPE